MKLGTMVHLDENVVEKIKDVKRKCINSAGILTVYYL